jgi:signal transduction histidine kinase/ABC-type multidrug transport system ATPase subunit
MIKRNEPILRMKNIHLFYGNVHALKGVDFDLYRGEIHALVGTHRAGKSSLMKILSGVEKKDNGEIILNGEKIDRFSIQSAIRKGIGMFYQDEPLIRNLSTLETIYFEHENGPLFQSKKRKQKQKEVSTFLEKYNITLNFKKQLFYNTLNEQYLVDFLNVVLRDPEVLILDELSSRFTPEEIEYIYPIIHDLRAQEKSIVYITHNLDEIMRLADRVTILYEGEKISTEIIKNLDEKRLIKLTYSYTLSREELEKENIELYNLKKYNEDIIRNIPVGVVILNEKNSVYLTNEAAHSIFKIEDKDYRESSFETLIKGINFIEKNLLLQKIKAQEYFTINESTIENTICKFVIIPFRDEEQNFLGTIILIEDITNEINLMDYLLRAEKVSSIAELAAGVAHEINNPLGIVKTYVDLLKVTKLDEGPANKLSKIEKEIARIAEIVKNLLSFSKSTGLKTCDVDIISIINDVAVLLEHKFKEKQIQLTSQFPVPNAFSIGDENRLKQLFMNLIINSIEAVEKGGKINIELSEDQNKTSWLVSVKDNGPGISEEISQKIFDPFFSTKQNMKNAGLGLSLCQHIVELHHGIMTCDSDPGIETCFAVTLPKTPVNISSSF